MKTRYPKRFGAMLHAFLDGWTPNQGTYDYQHMQRKTDPETGKAFTMHGQWIPCRSITELISTALSWSITDSYLTAQRFDKFDVVPAKEDGHKETVRSDHDSYRIDRIYSDSDPEDGEADCLDSLPHYKKMQDALEMDGHTPVWVNCSGRGFHTFTYLNRCVSWRRGQVLQDILGYTFGLDFDYWTPITRARMLRLPYSKNSRTNTWVLCVGRNMTLGGLRNAMRSNLEDDGCHWDNPVKIPPEVILKLHPGTEVLHEYRETKREKARAKIRRGIEKKAMEAHGLLEQGKSWPEVANLMGYNDERYLRYWVNHFFNEELQ